MTDRFESILDESISALQAGVPIEDILAEVPDYAAELRPLLYAATVLADPDPEMLPEERKSALRTQYIAQAAELAYTPPPLSQRIKSFFRLVGKRLTRRAVLNDLVTITITVTLTLIMTALVLAFAAGSSIPGDLLYGIKRGSENVQLIFTFNQDQRVALQEKFNERRLSEIDQLIEQNRAAVVQFKGILDAKGENVWIIEGYTVFLPEDIKIEGNPQEGDRVEVIGLLRTNNILVADIINKPGPVN